MKKFIAAPFGNYIKTKNTISVSGSWTVEKRTGRIIQIAKTLRYTKKGWVNKIGLRNPGVEFGLLNIERMKYFPSQELKKRIGKHLLKKYQKILILKSICHVLI
jgi:hypothetical protein